MIYKILLLFLMLFTNGCSFINLFKPNVARAIVPLKSTQCNYSFFFDQTLEGNYQLFLECGLRDAFRPKNVRITVMGEVLVENCVGGPSADTFTKNVILEQNKILNCNLIEFHVPRCACRYCMGEIRCRIINLEGNCIDDTSRLVVRMK